MKERRVVVMGLTNGSIGYIPTKQAIALGGYEAVSSMFSNEAGGIILEGWLDLIQSMN